MKRPFQRCYLGSCFDKQKKQKETEELKDGGNIASGATLFGASLEVYLFTTAVLYSITITLYLPFTGFVGYLKLTQF